MTKRGISSFFIGSSLSAGAKDFRIGTFLCFRIFLVSTKVRQERGQESRLSFENVLSQSTQTFCRVTL